MSVPSIAQPPPSLAICVVTRDAAADLPAFLEHLARLDWRPLEVVVADNASRDGTAAFLESVAEDPAFPVALRVLASPENLGFAAGFNRALAATDAPWILSLNADTRPRPDFARRLIERALAPSPIRVGAVTGRLVRFRDPAASATDPDILDACGIVWSPSWRHFDRGAEQPDRGQYGRAERVAGGTGAATLWRRAALEDVAIDGQALDEDFHSFREDAELALRLQERGWETIYEPGAVAAHRRHNTPARRRAMSPEVNLHSLKNRYLLRLYHQGPLNLLVTLVPALARDVAALAWVLAAERSSWPAYRWLWAERRRLWARRRAIRARRTAPRRAVDRWFWRRSLPLP